jgi:hypothetical protein
MSGKNKRLLAIGLFVVAFGALLWAEEAEAQVHLGTAVGINHTEDARAVLIGYTWDDRWELEYARHGGDDYEDINSWSVTRIVRARRGKNLEPFLQFGLTYWDEKMLATKWDDQEVLVDSQLTYRLGLGVRLYRVAELGWGHDSTAGRSDPNSGIDYIFIRFRL